MKGPRKSHLQSEAQMLSSTRGPRGDPWTCIGGAQRGGGWPYGLWGMFPINPPLLLWLLFLLRWSSHLEDAPGPFVTVSSMPTAVCVAPSPAGQTDCAPPHPNLISFLYYFLYFLLPLICLHHENLNLRDRLCFLLTLSSDASGPGTHSRCRINTLVNEY